jgi:putative methyltransferase (TIGR04325 family)
MIWSGVFSNFDQVIAQGSTGHDPDLWIQKSISRLSRVKSLTEFPQTDLMDIFSSNPLLLHPLLLEILQTRGRASVTDVGGNLGQLYHFVRKWAPADKLSWSIVELPELYSNGEVQELFDQNINWFTNWEQSPNECDILWFGSTLQYIEHLTDFAGAFLDKSKPKYICIADAMVGEQIPTFVSRQHYYESFFPTKFRNFSELDSELESLGYSVILKTSSLNSRNSRYYPSDGLGQGFQIPYPLDLIYRRKNAFEG